MLVPLKSSTDANIDASEIPLKKILLWNGASSWGGLKPGRGIFLKGSFKYPSQKQRQFANLVCGIKTDGQVCGSTGIVD